MITLLAGQSYPLANIDASTVAHTFVCQFICKFGVSRQVHTDQGTQFESDLFKQICRILDIDKTWTIPYDPQSDGLVERFNQTQKIYYV